MKKLVLIILIILCIATIGGVFALAVFDSDPVTGTITSDAYLFLEMNSEFSTRLDLLKDTPIVKAINLHIRSSNQIGSYLKINTALNEGKTLSNVSFSLYSSSDCNTLLKDLNGNNCTMLGDGTMTYAIPETTDTSITVYLKITVDESITEEDFARTGGKLTLSFSESV